MSFNDRTLTVVGESDYERITNRHIVLVGVGGVGGAVLECLVRFGVKKITINKTPIRRGGFHTEAAFSATS